MQVEVDEGAEDAKKEGDDDTKAEVRDLLIYFYGWEFTVP